jgi:hypothetical protein
VPLLHGYFYLVVSKAFFQSRHALRCSRTWAVCTGVVQTNAASRIFFYVVLPRFFFRSSLTGIFNVVFSPLFLTWYTPPPHFYTRTCRYHVYGLIFNVVFSLLFLTWSTPPSHFYTSRYLVKLRMKLAAPWYVQGGQMGENVAAAALRQPGSETLHVFGLGRGLAMARE